MKKIFSIIITLAMVLSMVNAPMASAATAVDIGEDWAVWIEDDFSTTDRIGGRANNYCIGYDTTRQFAFENGICKRDASDHGLDLQLGVAGDFAAEFDLFMNDFVTVSETNSEGTAPAIRMSIRQNDTKKDDAHEVILYWNNSYGLDSGDTEYVLREYATAQRKYAEPAIADGTPTHMNVKVVDIEGTVSYYYKWNTESEWNLRATKTYTPDETNKELSISFENRGAVDNLKIYRPISDIPKTPMQESETWGVQLKDDCSTTASWTPFFSYNLNKNSTYGYLNNAHSTQTGPVCNDLNHFLAMNKNIAVKGDFAADFDVFVDDLSYTNNLAKPNTFKLGMYSDIYTRTSETTKKDYTSLYSKTMFDWSTFTLADDAGVPHLANTARASKKYGVEAVATDTNSYYGTVSSEDTWNYMNMRFILIDNTITVYAKWDTSENWVEIHTGAITESDAAKGFVFHFDAFVGVDNLTIYRPKENIVKIPTTVTGSEFLGDDVDNMIVNPHFGTPAFTEPNGTVDIEFTNNTDVDFTKGTTDVYLSNKYKTWYAKAETPKSGENNIYLGTKSGWTTTIEVPGDISPELMDLEIIHTAADGIVTSYFAPQAVQVTEKLNQDFYSVAISDTHIDKWGGNGSQTKTGRILKLINETLSLAGARYLSHSGDVHDAAVPDRAGLVKETIGNAFVDSSIPVYFNKIAGDENEKFNNN